MAIEVIANGFDDGVPHPNDGVLPVGSQPQVPVVHQEIDAVLLGRDRIGIAFRDALHDLGAFHIHLKAAGGARLGAHFAAQNQRGLLGQIL